MKKGYILRNLQIQKIWFGGVGIASLSNWKKVIIKWGALPGAVVDAKVVKNKKDYIEARVFKIKSIDSQWVDMDSLKCSHYFFQPNLEWNLSEEGCKIGCGGCKWQILGYQNQIKLKQQLFEDSFRHIWQNIASKVEPLVPAPWVRHYRNKIEFSFWYCNASKEDKPVWGFHKQWEWASLVDVEHCWIAAKKANEIYEVLKDKILKNSLPVYNPVNHQWVWRHLMLRYGFGTDQLMVVLSYATKNLSAPQKKELSKFFNELGKNEKLNSQINSFWLFENNGLADVVRNQDVKWKLLFGESHIFEKLKIKDVEISFRISPRSFFQTNTFGAQTLFSTAIDMMPQIKWEIVDMYSGVGTIGLSFLKAWVGSSLLGVEVVKDAVEDAWFNAKINGLQNAKFLVWKAEDVIYSLVMDGKLDNMDLLIVDPPREGLHKKVIKKLIEIKKRVDFKLLYISCNPVTLARDVSLLLEWNFKLKKIRPVDMFPHTYHLETIAVFS